MTGILLEERAKELAEAVGGDAIELGKLADFRPETGMILANSTSIGMQPNVHATPIPKVFLHVNHEIIPRMITDSMAESFVPEENVATQCADSHLLRLKV